MDVRVPEMTDNGDRVREMNRQIGEMLAKIERLRALVNSCADLAENPGFIQAQDTEWDEGVNYAKRFIAKAIRRALQEEK